MVLGLNLSTGEIKNKTFQIYCEQKAAGQHQSRQSRSNLALRLILRVVGERGEAADTSKSTWQRRFAVLICLFCARGTREY